MALRSILIAQDTSAEDYRTQRLEMVRTQLEGRDITDGQVLAAMRMVPRHLFTPPGQRHLAYQDRAVPIGHGQTLSQPYIVAWMTQMLMPSAADKVLEIGAGSGYQTAVLARLVDHVYSIERVPGLYNRAAQLLNQLEHRNVTLILGDGSLGLPDQAPFDGILAAAVAPRLPEALLAQLTDGGRLVMPIGEEGGTQEMQRVIRRGGTLHIERLGAVRFVPLIGQEGFRSATR